jgi:hypothetical protein
MPDQMRDRRAHERNVRKQHQPFVDFRPAPVTDRRYSQYGEYQWAAEVEDRIRIDVEFPGRWVTRMSRSNPIREALPQLAYFGSGVSTSGLMSTLW